MSPPLSIHILAPPERVWEEIEHIRTHAEWMAEAESIEITSAQDKGVGTTAACVTRLGPLKVRDHTVVVVWAPRREMTIRHVGSVTGTGSFQLIPDGKSGTQFRWTEDLTYPWWMGGPIGGLIGGYLLRRIWRRNLAKLKQRIERPAS